MDLSLSFMIKYYHEIYIYSLMSTALNLLNGNVYAFVDTKDEVKDIHHETDILSVRTVLLYLGISQ